MTATDSTVPSEGTPARSWRPFRILLAVTLLLTTIQGAVGGPLAGMGGFNIATSTSFGDVFSAIMTSSGLLIFHAFEGASIFVLAAATATFAFRYKNRGVNLFAVLSMIAALIAVLGGYLHIGGSPAGIPLMSEGFIATYALLFITLYFTK